MVDEDESVDLSAGVVVVAPAEDLTSQMWGTTLAVNLTGTVP